MREPDKRSVVVELGAIMSLNRRAAVRALCGGALWMAALGRTALRRSWAAERRIKPGASSALIIVDVQNCFVKGGTLAVAQGEDVVPVINRLAPAFQNIILTQDWHNPGHTSFASSHPGKQPFDSVRLSYGNQVLWPDHCVQGTPDAALDPDLRVPQAQLCHRGCVPRHRPERIARGGVEGDAIARRQTHSVRGYRRECLALLHMSFGSSNSRTNL
jgi:hypothetical protein